jgi:hypothetical protein
MNDFNLEKAKKFGLKIPKKKYNEYDQDQLAKGVEVEKEHTDDEEICCLIAAHHLDEFPDYYDRLHKMEEEAHAELDKEPKEDEDLGSKLDRAFGVEKSSGPHHSLDPHDHKNGDSDDGW